MKIRNMGKFLLWITGGAQAITLFPFGVFVRPHIRKGSIMYRTLINHESIHWKQQKEMLCLLFYLWYVIEWLIKLPKYGKLAYYTISFEREAYKYDMDNSYLSRRKYYSWIKYLNKPI